jgi:hypothetical protein
MQIECETFDMMRRNVPLDNHPPPPENIQEFNIYVKKRRVTPEVLRSADIS